jgi:DNA-binding beta-propeller fold protein YncE
MNGKLALILFLCFGSIESQNLKVLFDKSIENYEKGNYEAFENLTVEALKIHPSHPSLLYNYALAKTKKGQLGQAYLMLKNLLSWNDQLNYQQDDDFNVLLDEVNYKDSLTSNVNYYRLKKETSSVFAELNPEFHIEDFIKIGQNIIFTDVLSGSVISYDSQNDSYRTLTELNGSALAITTANDEKLAYVTSSVISKYKNFKEEHNGRSFVYKIDLESGKILHQIELSTKANLGSISRSKNGKIYISNSLEPEIYILDSDRTEIIEVIKVPKSFSLQGLVLDKNEKYLYVADYIKGLVKIDLQDPKNQQWISSPDYLLKGIDGITLLDEKTIIAIQNGSKVKRVLELKIQNNAIYKVNFLDNNIYGKAEPTNGKLIGKEFYYNATSQWPFYNKNGKALKEKWVQQEIRKIQF